MQGGVRVRRWVTAYCGRQAEEEVGYCAGGTSAQCARICTRAWLRGEDRSLESSGLACFWLTPSCRDGPRNASLTPAV